MTKLMTLLAAGALTMTSGVAWADSHEADSMEGMDHSGMEMEGAMGEMMGAGAFWLRGERLEAGFKPHQSVRATTTTKLQESFLNGRTIESQGSAPRRWSRLPR